MRAFGALGARLRKVVNVPLRNATGELQHAQNRHGEKPPPCADLPITLERQERDFEAPTKVLELHRRRSVARGRLLDEVFSFLAIMIGIPIWGSLAWAVNWSFSDRHSN